MVPRSQFHTSATGRLSDMSVANHSLGPSLQQDSRSRRYTLATMVQKRPAAKVKMAAVQKPSKMKRPAAANQKKGKELMQGQAKTAAERQIARRHRSGEIFCNMPCGLRLSTFPAMRSCSHAFVACLDACVSVLSFAPRLIRFAIIWSCRCRC